MYLWIYVILYIEDETKTRDLFYIFTTHTAALS